MYSALIVDADLYVQLNTVLTAKHSVAESFEIIRSEGEEGDARGKRMSPSSREGHERPSTKTAVVPGAAFRVAELEKTPRP